MPPIFQAESWGRLAKVPHPFVAISDRFMPLPSAFAPDAAGSWLPYGLGRSYGDSCLNAGGGLLLTRQLSRFIAFDPATGVLSCEAGVSLAEILELMVPRGFFLPVTPGTKMVTVGGAIANDVHGKNHHRAGTFGCHVRRLSLRRTDGGLHECSPSTNSDLFQATIGGLGLTGLIVTADLQLTRIPTPMIACESLRFGSPREFLALARESDATHEHTVAWVDCLSDHGLGQGVFFRGNWHGEGQASHDPRLWRLTIPPGVPGWLMAPPAVRLFNKAYLARQRQARQQRLTGYDAFFYPLDKLRAWNRLYGPRGFYQYQCVVPVSGDHSPLPELLRCIANAGEGSFLCVLKVFGQRSSPGMLSFPRPGVTLALDFKNRGPSTEKLLNTLDRIVLSSGGALYPAKDARMPEAAFRRSFPRLEDFARHVDPGFSSNFWRRVTGAGMGLAWRRAS